MFIPARRTTPEFLDDPATDHDALAASGGEIAQCNRLFGGTRALLAELVPRWPALAPRATLLDIGCGVGDLPAAARDSAAAHGVELTVIAVDVRFVLARRAAHCVGGAVVADAFSLPFREASADIVTACQFLHHFGDGDIAVLAREMQRVARRHVIVSDLRRNWVAAAGLWIASWPLRFHRITRHDGVASVLKGFVPAELRETLVRAVRRDVAVTPRPAFRLTACWSPDAR
jgi:ubiquinone/menaquinone biosynthesis C-methylase UbiE